MTKALGRRYCRFVRKVHLLGVLSLAMAVAGIPSLCFDVILDPKEVMQLLAEIGKLQEDSLKARTQAARLEALYQTGERALALTTLMTRDVQSHGASDPSLVGLIMRRLKEYGIEVRSDAQGYYYDLAAFREYVKRAPTGKRAQDARFALIAFAESGKEIGALEESIAEKQRFLLDYPRYPDLSIIHMLLAQDHLRLGRIYSSQKNTVLGEKHQQTAEEIYRKIVKLYPKSPEAEAAADYLSQLSRAK